MGNSTETKYREMAFENAEKEESFSLRSQEREINFFNEDDIEEFLEIMFDDPDEFVVLSAPEAQHKVRFVQACLIEGKVQVQIAIEEEKTRLFCKFCSEETCMQLFLDFFANKFIPDMKEYEPVLFL